MSSRRPVGLCCVTRLVARAVVLAVVLALALEPRQALAAIEHYDITGLPMGYYATTANGATSVWPTYYMTTGLVVTQGYASAGITGTNTTTYNVTEKWNSSGTSSSTQPAYRFYDPGNGSVATIIPNSGNWQVLTGSSSELVSLSEYTGIQGAELVEINTLNLNGNTLTAGNTWYVSYMISFGNDALLDNGDRVTAPLMMRPDVSSNVFFVRGDGLVNRLKDDGGSAQVVQFAYMTSDNVWRRYNSLPSGYLDITEPVYMLAYVVKITGLTANAPAIAFDANTFRFTRNGITIDTQLAGIQNTLDNIASTNGSGGISSGVSDIANNATGAMQNISNVTGYVGFNSLNGVTSNSTITFNGLQLGEEFGNFAIPAFSVDLWAWCPDGLKTTIRTIFTMFACVAWAMGMKRFFDRIFHGEQVVSTE